jgi:two-component system, NarL family, response regulator DevR
MHPISRASLWPVLLCVWTVYYRARFRDQVGKFRREVSCGILLPLLCSSRGPAVAVHGGVGLSLESIVVLLLAENCLLREALVRVLRKKEDIVVVGAIPFSPSALEQVSAANPDVVLFDSSSIALTGPRLVSRLRQAGEKCKAVMVGMEDDEATFLQAVGEGVVGYVLKDASAAEIVRVIRAVAAGEAVCPPRFSLTLFQSAARDVCFAFKPSQTTKFGLSRREQQLVGLLRLGLSNKEIGSRLHLSEQTVKNHIHRILRKVGANNRLEIVERCQSDSLTTGDLVHLARVVA